MLGFSGIGGEGSHVYFYFAAEGKLASTAIVGEILATDTDGSSLAFVLPETGSTPAELDLWHAGPEGPADGGVPQVVQLPGEPSSGAGEYISDAQMSSDGSALAFVTATSLSSTFNSAGDEQIYRYDVPANTLGCISRDPAGVTPRGNAWMSGLLTAEERALNNPQPYEFPAVAIDQRGISSDGERVFFDSPDPLVPQDVNTNSPPAIKSEDELIPQARDVYEYEDGVVHAISNVRGQFESFFLDASPDGGNVFFASAEGMVPEDPGGNTVVWDARENGGFPVTSAPMPCGSGETCQPPAVSPPTIGPPASATFTGPGNLSAPLTPEQPKAVKKKTAVETRAQKLAKALKACHTRKSRKKRVACEKVARKRFGPVKKAKKQADRRAK